MYVKVCMCVCHDIRTHWHLFHICWVALCANQPARQPVMATFPTSPHHQSQCHAASKVKSRPEENCSFKNKFTF